MFTRRNILVGAGAGLLAAPAILHGQRYFTAYPFRLGIASGDPNADGFVIWTRLCPDPLDEHGGMPLDPFDVDWVVYEDEAMARIVQKGTVQAWPELAHSVHVEVAGLQPDRPYWYRFFVGRDKSVLGRARTTPKPGAPIDRLRFAAAGCQHYEDGLYTAYAHLAAEDDLAFVWHYGDYIYEDRPRYVSYGRDGQQRVQVRDHVGGECYSLGDYRRRYAQYKMDQDLQNAHRAAPWFMTFDDHELVDNWTGDVSPYQPDPKLFAFRRAAAMQAYYEHMPLRKASLPEGGKLQLYRRQRFGDLLDAHFLDTRQYRSPPPCKGGFDPVCPDVADTKRTVLDAAEERWLFDGLRARDTRWNLLAQQIMVMPLDRREPGAATEIRNMDSWGGYDAARERLLGACKGLGNVVVMTGDEHQNFAGELRRDGGRGDAVAVELVATSISSGGNGWVKADLGDRLRAQNPYLKHVSDRRGYMLCDVGRALWQTRCRVVDQVERPGGTISTLATISVERGKPALNFS